MELLFDQLPLLHDHVSLATEQLLRTSYVSFFFIKDLFGETHETSQQGINNSSQRKPVNFLVINHDTTRVIIEDKFWRSVRRTAYNVFMGYSCQFSLLVEEPGPAKVGNYTMPLCVDQNVLRLEIMVNDPKTMKVGKPEDLYSMSETESCVDAYSLVGSSPVQRLLFAQSRKKDSFYTHTGRHLGRRAAE